MEVDSKEEEEEEEEYKRKRKGNIDAACLSQTSFEGGLKIDLFLHPQVPTVGKNVRCLHKNRRTARRPLGIQGPFFHELSSCKKQNPGRRRTGVAKSVDRS